MVKKSRSTCSPLNARHLLPRDIAYQDNSLLFGMGCSGLCQDLFGRIRDEQFFACHTDALATILRIKFCGVPLQQDRVACKTLMTRLRLGQLFRVEYFFFYVDSETVLICHRDPLSRDRIDWHIIVAGVGGRLQRLAPCTIGVTARAP